MNYNNPFIKVEWEDTPENLTQERIKRVKTYFQNKYNTVNVKVVAKTSTKINNTRLQSLEASDNILDPQYQKNLVKDFLTENNIDVKWPLINRLDDKVNGEIDKLNQNKVRYNKWYIRKVVFSNFLSFGQDNVIEFTNLDGITVIESNPRNFGGKSTSSVDLLMFLFFNSTTKTKTNAEIFNKFTDENEVKVTGEVVIDDENYFIERTLTRKKSKTSDYTIKSELNFYKIIDGEMVNLSGEQRRETEAFIASAIGSEEDFLSTILTTGYNLEELIESKPTARGQILTKFLGLESLKQKEDIAREMKTEWEKKMVSNTYNITQLESDNEDFKNSIEISQNTIEEAKANLENYNDKLKTLNETRDSLLLQKSNDVDRDLIKVNPTLLQKEIDDLKTSQKASQRSADNVNVNEPSEYYYEDQHKELKTLMADLQSTDFAYKYEKTQREKLIKQFEEGTVCPTCNRALDDVDHTDEIEKIKKEIEDIENGLKLNQTNLDSLKEKSEKFDTLKSEYDTYERNKLVKARYELEVGQKQVEIDTKQSKLNNYDANKTKLENNLRIEKELIGLGTQIETATADIKQAGLTIQKHETNITNLTEKIAVNNDLMAKIRSEEEYQAVFKIYLTVFGKNGISKVILKNMIPLLNIELQRLLSDSCYFTLELNINDKNEVDFIMIDNETRVVKPLAAGSGYERTISSLALRSVLTKVSSLPKPNIVVMDEVFGKIADENLEMVGEFFKKIKNYFEHILVISHNPLIRNWSDNIIMVKKEENVSSIDYITTKIS
jgi:DNA repair exonuclease SbcCD ATPase subunit